MEEEVWKDVGIYYGSKQTTDFTGILEVSSLGRVRKVLKDGKRRMLKTYINDFGDIFVETRINGARYRLCVAKMMAFAWKIESKFGGECIKFRDGNRHNLRVDNLYWTMNHRSISAQKDYRYRHGEDASWVDFVEEREKAMTWDKGCYYRKFVVEHADGTKEIVWARCSVDCRYQIRRKMGHNKSTILSMKDFNKLCKEGVKL